MKTPPKGHSLPSEILTSIAYELGISVDDLQSIVIKVKSKPIIATDNDKLLETSEATSAFIEQRFGYCHCVFGKPGVMKNTCCNNPSVCCIDGGQ